MAYDETKNKELKSDELVMDEKTKFRSSVNQYDGGAIKVQIGPLMYKDKNDEWKEGKPGRLTEGQVRFLQGFLEETIDEFFGG